MIWYFNLPIECFLNVVSIKVEKSIISTQTQVEISWFLILDGLKRDYKLFHINDPLRNGHITLFIWFVILDLTVLQDHIAWLPSLKDWCRLFVQPSSQFSWLSNFLARFRNLFRDWFLIIDSRIVFKEFIDHLLMLNNLLLISFLESKQFFFILMKSLRIWLRQCMFEIL